MNKSETTEQVNQEQVTTNWAWYFKRVISVHRWLTQEDCHEFKASLDNTVSSRIALDSG